MKCDRCGKEIGFPNHIVLIGGPLFNKHYVLCRECSEELDMWLEGKQKKKDIKCSILS